MYQSYPIHRLSELLISKTFQMSFPFDWQPHVVSTQVARVGPLVLACVPGEFTTMAGRRVRAAVQEAAGANSVPILLGLCNTYSDYITTFEEYQVLSSRQS